MDHSKHVLQHILDMRFNAAVLLRPLMRICATGNLGSPGAVQAWWTSPRRVFGGRSGILAVQGWYHRPNRSKEVRSASLNVVQQTIAPQKVWMNLNFKNWWFFLYEGACSTCLHSRLDNLTLVVWLFIDIFDLISVYVYYFQLNLEWLLCKKTSSHLWMNFLM